MSHLPSAVMSGETLADILSMVEGGSQSRPTALLSSDLSTAKDMERKHEIVALVGQRLTVNFENYNRYRASSDVESATMVVSFLGDTAVGKSTTIRELMKSGEQRPFVQRASEQSASTTFNVNLYPCHSLFKGMTVNFLDFEGESGSSMPAMGHPAASFLTSSDIASARNQSLAASSAPIASSVLGVSVPSTYKTLTAALLNQQLAASGESSILERAKQVREHFPRLAYCASDVIVLIGTDKLFGS
jgi:hypothetical protein